MLKQKNRYSPKNRVAHQAFLTGKSKKAYNSRVNIEFFQLKITWTKFSMILIQVLMNGFRNKQDYANH